MELRCQLERHTAALYVDRAPVITNRRADAVLSSDVLSKRDRCFAPGNSENPVGASTRRILASKFLDINSSFL